MGIERQVCAIQREAGLVQTTYAPAEWAAQLRWLDRNQPDYAS